jgi:hypothetical protein
MTGKLGFAVENAECRVHPGSPGLPLLCVPMVYCLTVRCSSYRHLMMALVGAATVSGWHATHFHPQLQLEGRWRASPPSAAPAATCNGSVQAWHGRCWQPGQHPVVYQCSFLLVLPGFCAA